jgi:hypothetical protein
MEGKKMLQRVEESLRVAGSSNVVHVSLPVEVAYDFDKLVTVQKEIFGRLGHSACTSGWDIRWEIERRFIVDENLGVQVAGPGL